jgi:hypothetical protein
MHIANKGIGYWCWITREYSVERLCLEYLFVSMRFLCASESLAEIFNRCLSLLEFRLLYTH